MQVRSGAETMQMAVFVEDGAPDGQHGEEHRREPRAGRVHAKYDLVQHNEPGANMNSNLVSKVGRMKFTADQLQHVPPALL